MKTKLLVPFLLLLALPSWCQMNQLFTVDLAKEVVTRYVLQTSDQKIWLATSDGLYFMRESVFEKFEENMLAKEAISTLFEDNSGNMWVGCESGNIYLLNPAHTLSKWEPKEGAPQKGITCIQQAPDGNIWIATKGEGLYVFDHKYLYNFDSNDGLNDNAIYDIEIDLDNNVWVATDQGINICTYNNGVKKISAIGKAQGLTDEIVKCLKLSNSKTEIYIGYQEAGLDRINIRTKKITTVLRSVQLLDLDRICLDANLLLLSTISTGVFSYEEGSPTSLKKVFSSNRVNTIFTDQQSNTWIATRDKGLVHSNLNFQKYFLGENRIIQAIAGDYVGTNQGLYLMGTGTSPQRLITKETLNVVALERENPERLWVGTFGQGLFIFRNNNPIQKVKLPDENILSIEKYDKGVLVAALSGIFYLEDVGGRIVVSDFNQQISLPKYYVYKLFVDSRGTLWIGTGGKGLIKYDGISWQSINHIEQKEVKTVLTIGEDELHRVWFGIDKIGLARYQGDQFTLAKTPGLRCKNITDILSGQSGNLLIVHSLGIDLYRPDAEEVTYFEAYLNNYKVDNNINAGYFGNRQFYLASFSNLYVVNDKVIPAPSISLDYLEVNGEKLHPSKQEFDYSQNNIHFNISAYFLDQSQKQSFEFLLEGYDSKWRRSHLQDLEYQNLASGSYVFKVRSFYGARRSTLMSFPFRIKYPIWQRSWFIILVVLSGSLLFYYWLKARDIRQSRELKLQRENIENQLITLKSQINPHFLFNSFNTLIAVIETTPAIAVEFVSKLSDFYRKVMLYREKSVIPIAEELSLISDFSYLIEKRFGENIRITNNITELDGFVVPFAIQMLVENAVKHNIVSKEKPLLITIFVENRYYVVQNNLQVKKIKEASTNFGLDFIRKHYGFLDRRKVEVIADQTYFTVKIPILKNESTAH